MDSYYKEICWKLHRFDEYRQLDFNYQHFRSSWISYLNLLDIKYEDGFLCNKCGDNPKIVVMDAIMLGIRQSLIPIIEEEGSEMEVIPRVRYIV